MKAWRALVRAYLVHRQTAGYADGTLEAAARWLKRFMAWCERRGLEAPAQVTAADVAAFRRDLAGTAGPRCDRYGASSLDQALRQLRAFFAWAVRREHILFSPMQEMVLPRVARPALVRLTIEEVRRLLAAADDGTLLGLRDRAVLETFYGTGIRRSELRELDLGDLDLAGRKLRVLGKGRYERLAPVGDALAAVLSRYLDECRPQLVGRSGDAALFVSANGARYADNGLAEMVRRAGKRVGLRLAPHALRHAFALHLLECGADFYEVQRMLGHRSPKSTEIYTDVATAAFSRKFRHCHPRGRQITRSGGDA